MDAFGAAGDGGRDSNSGRRGRGRGRGPRSSRVRIDSNDGGGLGNNGPPLGGGGDGGGGGGPGDGGGGEPPQRLPGPRMTMHSGNERRPLRFWQPFNDWWRSDLERLGRRPSAQEILAWYSENAHTIWRDETPSLQETRVHAKCLRSLPLVRDYFRSYRAKRRNAPGEDECDSDDGNDGRGGGMGMDDAQALSFVALQQEHAFRAAYSAAGIGGGGAGGGNNGGGGNNNNDYSALYAGPHPLWSAHAASLDPQQQELLRTLALTQLQHAAAVQQQITLAHLASQYSATAPAAAAPEGSAGGPKLEATVAAALDGGALAPHDLLLAQVQELQSRLKLQVEQVASRDAEIATTQRALEAAEGRLRTKAQKVDTAKAQKVNMDDVLSALTELGQQAVVGTGANRQVGGVAKKAAPSPAELPPRKRHQAAAAGGSTSAELLGAAELPPARPSAAGATPLVQAD